MCYPKVQEMLTMKKNLVSTVSFKIVFLSISITYLSSFFSLSLILLHSFPPLLLLSSFSLSLRLSILTKMPVFMRVISPEPAA